MTERETDFLIRHVPKAYGTEIQDILITALMKSFYDSLNLRTIQLVLEGHGRQELGFGENLVRTVGWFTSIYPIILSYPESGKLGKVILEIKEQLRRIPNHGISYGLLKYLNPDPCIKQFFDHPEPKISFNYLGQVDRILNLEFGFILSEDNSGYAHSKKIKRFFEIEITVIIRNGELHVDFIYNLNLHDRKTIEGFVDLYKRNIKSLILHCVSPETEGYSKSDFLDTNLSDLDIETIIREINTDL